MHWSRCTGLLVALAFVACAPARAELPLERFKAEGEFIVLEITSAPFQVSRKYKSMEGPSVSAKIKLQDLAAAGGKLQLKEAPPLNGGNLPLEPKLAACGRGTELWWFRGAKIEVLEPEHDVASNPGFLCHFNLDVDTSHRAKLFPTFANFGERALTFTSGMNDFALPEGYGIPVASEESWRFTFQALNHNLEGRHSFRHRLTLYFSKHAALNQPLKAATWSTPFVAPPMDGAGEPSVVCTCCGKLLAGLNAPNSTGLYRMKDGRTATGHWVVPPGKGSWTSAAREFGNAFNRDRELVAAYIHVHPFAERMTLTAHDPGCKEPRNVWTGNVRNVEKGVGLAHLETLSTTKGIPMPAASEYQLTIDYDNTSGVKQDAMGMMGLYLTVPEWRLPDWAVVPQKGNLFCGIENEASIGASSAAPAGANALYNVLPHFAGTASATDAPYVVEMVTRKGTLRFRVNPAWAPKTAAALKQVFARNLYAERDFIRVEPGYVIQTPELLPGQVANETDRALLVRLPGEPSPEIKHRPGVLSMAMWPGKENSATSSFSFMLGWAPHLDGQFTVFGELEDFPKAKAILDDIVKAADNGERVLIVSTKLIE